MVSVKKHINILGKKVEDRVTGYEGIVTSISFDLYGCIQALVNPGMNKDEKLAHQTWFDVGRLKITNDQPVMDVPDFEYGTVAEGKKGPAVKPPQKV